MPRDRLDDAASTLGHAGWRSTWGPARRTQAGGLTGGTACHATRRLGLASLPGSDQLPPHRFTASLVTGWIKHGVVILSVYFEDGCGVTGPNAELLDNLALYIRAMGRPWIVCADWQASPAQLTEAGWPEAVGGFIVAANRPTCFVATGAREIDFMVASDRLRPYLVATGVDEVAQFKPHRVVWAQWASARSRPRVRRLRRPKAFPHSAVFGPRPQPPDCEYIGRGFEQAVATGNLSDAKAATAELYRVIEVELAGITGVAGSKPHEGRAAGPRFAMLPELWPQVGAQGGPRCPALGLPSRSAN